MANRVEIAFQLGSTWELLCDCFNVDRTPTIIASAEWRLCSTTARLVKVTSPADIDIIGPGQCLVTVQPSLQTNIVPGTYDHELWILDDQGIESVQIVGPCTIVQSLKKRFP
jgi:hypothetical protein